MILDWGAHARQWWFGLNVDHLAGQRLWTLHLGRWWVTVGVR